MIWFLILRILWLNHPRICWPPNRTRSCTWAMKQIMQVPVFLHWINGNQKNSNLAVSMVNIVADKTQAGSLGAVGYDDEGVKCKEWDIIKDGILVNYQAIRDQAHIIGLKESQGCCYAQSWSRCTVSAYAECFSATRKSKN